MPEKADALLLAILPDKIGHGVQARSYGLAWLNVAGGELTVAEIPPARLAHEFERLRPAEIVVPDGAAFELGGGPPEGVARATQNAWRFDPRAGEKLLLDQFGVATLDGFGCAGLSLALGAAGALLRYAQATQGRELLHVQSMAVETGDEYLTLDAVTRRNLEITETLRGAPAPTLFATLDSCITSPICSRA